MKYENGWEGLVRCEGVRSCQRLHCCHLTLCPASQSSILLDRFGRKLWGCAPELSSPNLVLWAQGKAAVIWKEEGNTGEQATQ